MSRIDGAAGLRSFRVVEFKPLEVWGFQASKLGGRQAIEFPVRAFDLGPLIQNPFLHCMIRVHTSYPCKQG